MASSCREALPKQETIPQGKVEGIGKCCKKDLKLWISLGIGLLVVIPIGLMVFDVIHIENPMYLGLALFMSGLGIFGTGIFGFGCIYIVCRYCEALRKNEDYDTFDFGIGIAMGMGSAIIAIVLIAGWNELWRGAF